MTDWQVLGTAAGVGACLTPVVAMVARRLGVVDQPAAPRKLHPAPTPLLGGLALYLTLLPLGVALWTLGLFTGLDRGMLGAVALAGGVLVVGGTLDDRWHFSPGQQFVFPLAATLVLVVSGLRISFITHPLGGVLQLPVLIGVPLTAAWVLGMTYTTKLLDGLDGLATGMAAIAALVMYAVSLRWDASGGTGRLALLVAGAAIGFWVYNASPARIFLGEGGSTLLGMLLAVLAVISGSKVATALLVVGVAVFDVVAVLVARRRSGQSLLAGDRRHLHFRLVQLGLTPRAAAGLYLGVSALVGVIALTLRTVGKMSAIALLLAVLWLFYGWLQRRQEQVRTGVG